MHHKGIMKTRVDDCQVAAVADYQLFHTDDIHFAPEILYLSKHCLWLDNETVENTTQTTLVIPTTIEAAGHRTSKNKSLEELQDSVIALESAISYPVSLIGEKRDLGLSLML